MTDSITVTTGARLHFGLLVAGPPERRSYGGLGLMIDQPRCSLTARLAEQMAIHADSAIQPRIADMLRTLERGGPQLHIEVHEAIPTHAGLGSGTQLALAVGTAWARLRGDAISVVELSRRLGRGTRSVVGSVGFESGGLIGQHVAAECGTISAAPMRADFPVEWKVALVTPPGDVGLSGESERQAFRDMPAMSDGQLHLLGDLQGQLLSSASLRDFRSFSEVLQRYGETVGRYFAPLQSGIFASRRMSELAEALKGSGYRGIGQTSWGPTLFALCETGDEASELAEQVRRWDRTRNCRVQIVTAKNSGAAISSR